MPHTYTQLSNFFCPYGQEKLFQLLEEKCPKLFAAILLEVEEMKKKSQYDIVVILYRHTSKDNLVKMATSLDNVTACSFENSIRSYNEELAWEHENLSVTLS